MTGERSIELFVVQSLTKSFVTVNNNKNYIVVQLASVRRPAAPSKLLPDFIALVVNTPFSMAMSPPNLGHILKCHPLILVTFSNVTPQFRSYMKCHPPILVKMNLSPPNLGQNEFVTLRLGHFGNCHPPILGNAHMSY